MAGLTSIVAVCGASRQLDTRTLEAKGAYAIHGVGMMTHRSWPALELEVELKDVSPRTANISDELLVEMILRNPTDHTVWIPSSKDFNEIMKPDVVGRRAMHFSILISGLTGFDDLPSSYFTSDSVTIGAESIEGSMLPLSPGEVLTVKTSVKLFSASDALLDLWRQKATTGLVTVKAQAQVTESTISDDLIATNSPGLVGASDDIELVLDLKKR